MGCIKSLHATAIRNTVSDDPEDMAVYRATLWLAVNAAKAMVDEAVNSYDHLLPDIANSQPYKN